MRTRESDIERECVRREGIGLQGCRSRARPNNASVSVIKREFDSDFGDFIQRNSIARIINHSCR